MGPGAEPPHAAANERGSVRLSRVSTRVQSLWREWSRRFAGKVAVVAGGAAAGQLLIILASPVLTRIYTPSDFGVLVVFTAIYGTAAALFGWRYEQAALLPGDDRKAASLIAVAGFAALVGVSVLGATVWMLGDAVVVAKSLGAPGLSPFFWLIPVVIVPVYASRLAQMWATRHRRFELIAVAGLNRGVWSVATQLSLSIIPGPLGLLVGRAVGDSVGLGAIVRDTWRHDRASFLMVRLGSMIAAAREYARFPLLSTWVALLNNLGSYAPGVALAMCYGAEAAGLYAVAQRVVDLPFKLVARAISKVFIGEAAHRLRVGDSLVRGLFGRILVIQLLIGAPIMGSLAVVAPDLSVIVFGEEWRQTGEFMRALVPLFLVRFITVPVSGILTLLQLQAAQIWREALRLAMLTLPLFVAVKFGAASEVAVLTLSISGTFSYLLGCGLAWKALRGRTGGDLLAMEPGRGLP